jgi:heptosyltransferase II
MIYGYNQENKTCRKTAPMKILIIKLGAIGDVVRTTPILRALKGEITWVTLDESVPFLRGISAIRRVLAFRDFKKIINEEFDWVINLEEDWKARALSRIIRAARKTEWTDKWCLLSIDDREKKANRKTYQYFMFKTIGCDFKGEEYLLSVSSKRGIAGLVGIDKRSGDKWKMKRWTKFPEFITLLKKEKIKYRVFRQKEKISDFLNDINECEVVVTGDTLTMHLALGLKKKVIALFGPTSSPEIYGYGRLAKIVSPIGCGCCYKRECVKKPNCMSLIGTARVFNKLKSLLKG